MKWFKRKTESSITALNPIDATAAKNLAILSNQVRTLEAVEKHRHTMADVFIKIKEQSEQGKRHSRVLVMLKAYEAELFRQAPNAQYEIDWFIFRRVEDIGITSSYIKLELEKLGYAVQVRELKIQVRRVAGDTGSFFAGHDIAINW